MGDWMDELAAEKTGNRWSGADLKVVKTHCGESQQP